MSESVYFLSLCLPLGTILLVFGMRYFSAIQQARVRLSSDAAYRRIAEQAAATQSATAAALSEIGTRLAAIEKILKDVE